MGGRRVWQVGQTLPNASPLSVALVSLVAENVKPTFALMLSQAVQSLLILVLLFLAHTPAGVLQQCQHILMEV